MTQSIQVAALAEEVTITENNHQGTDQEEQGLMCRYKKTILISGTISMFIIIIVLVSILSIRSATPCQCLCPVDWVNFQNKCYYFSKEERDWNSSRSNCSTHRVDLTTIDTEEEMRFLSGYKGSYDHWIGLKMTGDQSGQWVNGTKFNKWFAVKGNEECAYLNDDGAATARCYTERRWICRKEIH
ncbi:C-type lectin domain family 2 member B isoform X1 [Tupaia chinensis]|uniref:C-type lectin domain family 2 member B isoform X1 n=2 Tax=Tupaia chinensis TaxID=246437 RepID=UPI000FFC8069|nr:C-type lectin domain family 2 member B isoform X1 [Tupaia chinensis]XP_027632348.1 C-type lectin domain family 2 member B isoform X1 [Tupaia chinensis]XP_027632352.1 C-type lectin domain family 2 member B isoform X1 [Tupaia chinensis]